VRQPLFWCPWSIAWIAYRAMREDGSCPTAVARRDRSAIPKETKRDRQGLPPWRGFEVGESRLRVGAARFAPASKSCIGTSLRETGLARMAVKQSTGLVASVPHANAQIPRIRLSVFPTPLILAADLRQIVHDPHSLSVAVPLLPRVGRECYAKVPHFHSIAPGHDRKSQDDLFPGENPVQPAVELFQRQAAVFDR
jgi:hypothetical protein